MTGFNKGDIVRTDKGKGIMAIVDKVDTTYKNPRYSLYAVNGCILGVINIVCSEYLGRFVASSLTMVSKRS